MYLFYLRPFKLNNLRKIHCSFWEKCSDKPSCVLPPLAGTIFMLTQNGRWRAERSALSVRDAFFGFMIISMHIFTFVCV